MKARQQRILFWPVPTRMLLAVFIAALVSGYLISLPRATADERQPPPEEIRISLEDGLLSLEADEVQLQILLEALGDVAGFKLELRGEAATRISPSIARLPLHQALAQILGAERISYVLAFAPAQPGEAQRRVSKLTIFSKQTGQGQRAGAPAFSLPQRPAVPVTPDRQDEQEAIEILEQFLFEAEDPEIRDATLEALRDIETLAADL